MCKDSLAVRIVVLIDAFFLTHCLVLRYHSGGAYYKIFLSKIGAYMLHSYSCCHCPANNMGGHHLPRLSKYAYQVCCNLGSPRPKRRNLRWPNFPHTDIFTFRESHTGNPKFSPCTRGIKIASYAYSACRSNSILAYVFMYIWVFTGIFIGESF